MRTFFATILLTFSCLGQAQVGGLLARYYFNGGNANDDIGPYNGTVVGATLTADRFGNPNHAYHFACSVSSYINLTTNPIIKRPVESISLWASVDNPCYLGSGYNYNPILVTKCQPGNNYYEAYSLYYDFSTTSFITIETQPPYNQQYFHTSAATLNTWYHLVLCYDNDTISLYLNSVLQQKVHKGYTSVFLSGDSVMLGNSSNVWNDRFFNGMIDDIGFYDHVLSQTEVMTLYNEGNPTSVEATNELSKTILYPNPCHNSALITLKNAERYKIRDIIGNELRQGDFLGRSDISLEGLPPGIYYIEVQASNGSKTTQKIVKE